MDYQLSQVPQIEGSQLTWVDRTLMTVEERGWRRVARRRDRPQRAQSHLTASLEALSPLGLRWAQALGEAPSLAPLETKAEAGLLLIEGRL